MPMLKKMKMPKREEISIEELDAEMPSEEGMSEESATTAEMEPSTEAPSLDTISDEELMAELKKRGLMSKMGGEEDMEMSEMGEEDVEEYDDEMMG